LITLGTTPFKRRRGHRGCRDGVVGFLSIKQRKRGSGRKKHNGRQTDTMNRKATTATELSELVDEVEAADGEVSSIA